MACKISTAPINLLSSNKTACGNKCNLFYNYGNSSCYVINKSNYLDIKCFDGSNYVDFGVTGRCRVTDVRLYKPSLNMYDGKPASAELIITHSSTGKNVYICIPIEVSNNDGSSAKWFSQIIPFSPSSSNSEKNINVSNFSLNNVIPQNGFYIYEGGTFNWGCKKTDVMILFHKKTAMTIKGTDYKRLAKLIKPASYNVRSNPPYITYNSIGTSSGPGKNPGSSENKTLTCVPITDQDGINIEDGGVKDLPWEAAAAPEVSSESAIAAKNQIWQNIAIILAIVVGVCLIWLLGWAWKKVMSGGGGGSTNIFKKPTNT